MTFLGLHGKESELGQQSFSAHSYHFYVNSIFALVPPESRNSPLCVQWDSERASWAPSGHGSSSENSWPLIQNAVTCKSSVLCVPLQVHREACCLKVVEPGRMFEFLGLPVPWSPRVLCPIRILSRGLSHLKTVLEFGLFSQKCGRHGLWSKGKALA